MIKYVNIAPIAASYELLVAIEAICQIKYCARAPTQGAEESNEIGKAYRATRSSKLIARSSN